MSAIYGIWDASDLLCERSREWCAHAMKNAFVERETGREGYVDLSHPHTAHPGRIIHCISDIYEHDDPDFPPHSLLWVIRTGAALVTCRGFTRTPQPVGSIIAFNCHMKHALRYPRGSYSRLWAAWNVDKYEPWTEATARTAIIDALRGSA